MTEHQAQAIHRCHVTTVYHVGRALNLRPARCRGWRRLWRWGR